MSEASSRVLRSSPGKVVPYTPLIQYVSSLMRGSNEVLTVYSDGPDNTTPDDQNLPGPTQPLPFDTRYSMVIDTINYNWKVDIDAVVAKLRNWLKGKEIIYDGKNLQEIPTSLKSWAAATHNARQKLIKLYCYLEDNDAGILMQLMAEIQIETDQKKEVCCTSA